MKPPIVYLSSKMDKHSQKSIELIDRINLVLGEINCDNNSKCSITTDEQTADKNKYTKKPTRQIDARINVLMGEMIVDDSKRDGLTMGQSDDPIVTIKKRSQARSTQWGREGQKQSKQFNGGPRPLPGFKDVEILSRSVPRTRVCGLTRSWSDSIKKIF